VYIHTHTRTRIRWRWGMCTDWRSCATAVSSAGVVEREANSDWEALVTHWILCPFPISRAKGKTYFYIYVYIDIYINVCIYIYTHICIYTYMQLYIHVCLCVCICVYISSDWEGYMTHLISCPFPIRAQQVTHISQNLSSKVSSIAM